MDRSNATERLATLEQRLGDHESRCEERLGEIKATVGSTLRAVEGLKTRAWGVAAALLAWAMAQLWSENSHHFERLDREQPVVTRSLLAHPAPSRIVAGQSEDGPSMKGLRG